MTYWATLPLVWLVPLRLALPLRGPGFSHRYDYESSGRDWKAGSCGVGRKQSPIDLPPEDKAEKGGNFTYEYQPGTSNAELSRTLHGLFVDLFGLGYGGITLNDRWHHLQSMSVHSDSEHTWDGKKRTAELQLVHKSHDSSDLLVVAIGLDSATPPTDAAAAPMAAPPAPGPAPAAGPAPGPAFFVPPEDGADFSPVVQAFVGMAPPLEDTKVQVHTAKWDLNALLDKGKFYSYAGSSTTPPCAEVVTWLIRTDSVKISDAQAQALHDVIGLLNAGHGNSRATMPRNERPLHLLEAKQHERMQPKPVITPTYKPPPTGREVRVKAYANQAIHEALKTARALDGLKAYQESLFKNEMAAFGR